MIAQLMNGATGLSSAIIAGEWGVGSRVKTFRCLTFIISLCPNVLGGCYIGNSQ
ncbi:hypothetical protein NSP_38900 [Nodularia spumigena CCY9414]|nr:hypothetical protein NSP_38900 [Nodularia spumigena CCY9414]